MNNWKNYTVNIGTVKQRTKVEVKFISNINLDISRVQPGCSGCTKFIDYKDNVLTLQHTASDFPVHLGNKVVIIDKNVEVFYNDGTRDDLKFVGILKR